MVAKHFPVRGWLNMMATLKTVVLLFSYMYVLLSEARIATELEKIYTNLLDGYRPVSPAVSPNGSIQISVGFELYQVESLDGKTQVLRTAGCLIMYWTDQRLSWVPHSYEGMTSLTIDANKIWVPLIGLKNSATKVIDPEWRQVFRARVFYNGLVQWSPCGAFASLCSLDMLKFPFDTQKCSLDFGNVLEPAEVVNITTDMKAVDLQSFYPSNEFEVFSDEVGRVVYTTEELFNHRYIEIHFRINLKRRPIYYVMNIIIPTAVLALLSALNFIVPTDSGERLSLGVTILLAFSVFVLILSDNTPQSSDPPALGIYLSVVSTISGIHVLMQMVLVNMCHVRPIREVPKPLKMVQKYISCRLMSDVTEVQPPNDGNEIQPVTDELSIGEDKSNVHPANEISSILNCTQVLSDKVKSEEKEKALLQDWKSIADTFDRCFSCLSLIAQLLMTIICFGILPTLGEN